MASNYESMTTEELQEILRRDAHTTGEDALDTDTVLEICAVLSSRRTEPIDVEAAYPALPEAHSNSVR